MASWKRSGFCNGGGCVEVALSTDGSASVRSSRHPGLVIPFDPEEWSAFVAGVKAGEFDAPRVESDFEGFRLLHAALHDETVEFAPDEPMRPCGFSEARKADRG